MMQEPQTYETIAVPVITEPGEDFGDIKCAPPPDCGLLYDTLAAKWGKFKDEVDELRVKINDLNVAWEEKKAQFMRTWLSLKASLARCEKILADAISDINNDQEELDGLIARKR